MSEGLRSVNLEAGGVGDRPVSSYSGGMKRRLSVAISFMGDPLVVYLDEPSTVRREVQMESTRKGELSRGAQPACRRSPSAGAAPPRPRRGCRAAGARTPSGPLCQVALEPSTCLAT